MRILLSTSFHENLPALAGFHLNWRAAFSGQMVTLAHLSATTRADMLQELVDSPLFPSGETLIVNPVSIPTRFGTALPMMIHNHRTATRMGIEASHIFLASPYLYAFQSELAATVAATDAGLPAIQYPIEPHWAWHDVVASDPRLVALARYLGTDLRCGRADGVFLSRALFDDMLAVLLRFFSLEEIMALDPIYPLEEIVFPTILPQLLGPSGAAIRIGPTRAKVWEVNDPPTPAKFEAAFASGLYACGKRVPQSASHPLRRAVLARLPGVQVLQECLGTSEA